MASSAAAASAGASGAGAPAPAAAPAVDSLGSAASSGGSAVSSVPSSQLTGHSRPVLCLATPGMDSAHPHLLLSGSEDSTCRVWDLRVGQTVRCLKAFSSAAAASPAVTAVAFHPRQSHTVFATAARTLHRFDLRADREAVVQRASQASWPQAGDADDEINQLHIHPSGNYLALADDSGDVRIMDIQPHAGGGKGGAPFKTLSGSHSNLCSTAQFRPKQTWELWSGGMDSQVCVWDFSRGRCTHQLSMQATSASTSSNQTLNPPFVNGLTFSHQGDTAVAASGNGEIVLWDAKKNEERRRLLGHTHSVMHVGVLPLPPSFSALSSFTSPSCLLSAGNDQTLLLWDLQAALAAPVVAPAASAAAAAPASGAAARNRKKKEKAKAKRAAASSSAAAAAAGDDDAEDDGAASELSLDQLSLNGSSASASAASASSLPAFSSPWLPASAGYSAAELEALPDSRFVRFRWRHPRKINAVLTSPGLRDASAVLQRQKPSLEIELAADGSTGPLCTSGVAVYVADTDTAITAYHLR